MKSLKRLPVTIVTVAALASAIVWSAGVLPGQDAAPAPDVAAQNASAPSAGAEPAQNPVGTSSQSDFRTNVPRSARSADNVPEPNAPESPRPIENVANASMDDLMRADNEMEREAADLASQYHQNATEEKRSEIRKELTDLSQRHFDVLQQRYELELSRLEERVRLVREQLSNRKELRQQIVARRIAQLLQERDPLQFRLEGRSSQQQGGLFPFGGQGQGAQQRNLYEQKR